MNKLIRDYFPLVLGGMLLPCAMAQSKVEPATPPAAFAPFGGGQTAIRAESSRDSKSSSSSKRSSSSKNRPPEVSVRLNEIVVEGKRVNQPLIIRTGRIDARTTDQLREDLAVMARILDKTAEEHAESFHAKAAGIDILALSSGGRFARNLYIEDFGVLFTLNVGIPLKGESKVDDDDEKENGNTEEWEEARNEVLGRKRRSGRVVHAHPPQREFNQDQVNELRAALIETLKNASNIRNLKAADWITVVVRGPGSDGADEVPPEAYAAAVNSGIQLNESTMILRVKKSDVDKAAEDKTADLAKNVTVAVY